MILCVRSIASYQNPIKNRLKPYQKKPYQNEKAINLCLIVPELTCLIVPRIV